MKTQPTQITAATIRNPSAPRRYVQITADETGGLAILARTDRGTDIDADGYHASLSDDRKWEVTCKIAGWLYGFTPQTNDQPACEHSQLNQISELLEMMAEQAEAVGG